MRLFARAAACAAVSGTLAALCLTAPARAAVNIANDVAYGADARMQSMDIYSPDSGSHPGVILIHGGAWAFGDKRFYDPLCARLAADGFVAFTINYRLLPKSHYPDQLDDAQRAVRWMRAHAAAYHLDPARIGAVGDSAGGHLVALLGTFDTRDNSDAALASQSSRVQAVVDFYGPMDFTLPPATVNPGAAQLVINFFGATPDKAPAAYREGSPIVHVDAQSAPFLIVHGSGDTLVPVDQSLRMQAALTKAHVPVTLVVFSGYPHGFLNPAKPESAGALIEEFLTRILKP